MEKIKFGTTVTTAPSKSFWELVKSDEAFMHFLKLEGVTSDLIKKYAKEFYLLLLEKRTCSNCLKDSCLKSSFSYYQTIFQTDSADVSFVIRPCLYYRNTAFFYRQTDLDPKLLLIDRNELTNTHVAERQEVLKQFILYKNGHSSDWLYLSGAKNSGKNFIIVSLLNTILRAKVSNVKEASFVSYLKTIKDLERKRYDVAFDEYLLELAAVPFLVIDDFAQEGMSNFLRDSVLIPLLQKRREQHLLTVFISRYDASVLEAQMSGGYGKGSKIKSQELMDLIMMKHTRKIKLSSFELY
ncbi:MAG: hypothetical protein LBR37_04075 [Erysipelotrichaceae bacterium]|jgi:DNA replication protein DnaC|nr:hypothetical protein [Erysipelotrichaceae bacterium]